MDYSQLTDLASVFAELDLLEWEDLRWSSTSNRLMQSSQKSALQRRAAAIIEESAREVARLQLRYGPSFSHDLYRHHMDIDSHNTFFKTPRPETHPPVPKYECSACAELFLSDQLLTLPCEHRYCTECLEKMFTGALALTGTFPTQCCREEIPFAAARPFLTADLMQRYEIKQLEQNTPNKTYCSRPQCGNFIPPDFVGPESAFCPQCSTETCAKCKAAAHEGEACSTDPGLEQFLALAQSEGWQSCPTPNCNSMIEKTEACNHITFVPFDFRSQTGRLVVSVVVSAAPNSATIADAVTGIRNANVFFLAVHRSSEIRRVQYPNKQV